MARNKPSSEHQFPGLDGLRGIAAIVVVFLHGTLTFNVGYVPGSACLAVDFFFILSGFVISYAYDDRLNGHSRGMTWLQFMTARVIRLYPMLLVGTALGATVTAVSEIHKHQFHVWSYLAASFGAFGVLPIGLVMGTVAFPLNLAVWSMFFEFVVNALYGSRFGRSTLRTLTVFAAAAGMALVPLILWGGPYIQIGFATTAKFLLGFVRVTYPFWIGVLLSRVALFRAMPRVPFGVTGLALALLLMAPIDNPIYTAILVLVVLPAIIAFAASASVGRVSSTVCSVFGRLSYPLYMVHWPIFKMLHGMAETSHLSLPPWIEIASGCAVSILAAELVLLSFDEPARRWLGGRLSRAGRLEAGATA